MHLASRIAIVSTLTLVLTACQDSTGPSDPEPTAPVEMIPVPPVTEELRPDFLNACAAGHNSGPECYKLSVAATAAAGYMAKQCWTGVTPLCLYAAAQAGVAGLAWGNGRDAYGHRGPEDCNGCDDSTLRPLDSNDNGGIGNRTHREAP